MFSLDCLLRQVSVLKGLSEVLLRTRALHRSGGLSFQSKRTPLMSGQILPKRGFKGVWFHESFWDGFFQSSLH